MFLRPVKRTSARISECARISTGCIQCSRIGGGQEEQANSRKSGKMAFRLQRQQQGTIDTPLLLIDDEADSASVNTNPSGVDPTQINQRIRALLRLFTRSSYLGFTATPFANIFIDPDTEHEMLGDDLFPSDFIYTLDSPTNYVGPTALFGDQPRFDLLRTIEDAYDIFPLRHKSILKLASLPEITCGRVVFLPASKCDTRFTRGRVRRIVPCL